MTAIETIDLNEMVGRMITPRGRETGRDPVRKMRSALEAGVEFVHPNGGASGIRLRNIAT